MDDPGGLFHRVAGENSPEALFVRSALAGGINNLLTTFFAFDQFRNDPEFAGDVTRQSLHPYFRLYHDIRRFHDDATSTSADITIDGDDAEKAAAYYKTAPFPADADMIGTSKVVYASIFSGLLVAEEVGDVSLDFTMSADGENGFVQIENPDGCLADRLKKMIVRPETRPFFLEPIFVSGMNVQGNIIAVPFRVARIL